MKKLIVILSVIALILSFAGCKKGDSNTYTPTNDIVESGDTHAGSEKNNASQLKKSDSDDRLPSERMKYNSTETSEAESLLEEP